MNRNGNILQNIDWVTVGLYLAMIIFGWLNIYGACYNFDQSSIVDFSNNAGKQLVWMIGAVCLGGLILLIDYKIYDVVAYVLYGLIIIVLIITPFLTSGVKGSNSWITLGPIRIQPVEFAKVVTALAVAKYMGRYEYKLRTWRNMIVPFALILVPMFITMVWEKETGSALVFAAFLLVFYRQGMSGYILWGCVVAVALFILAIRFSVVALPWGTGHLGILLCMALLIGLVVFFHLKEKRLLQGLIVLAVAVFSYAIGLLINIWWKINFDILAVVITALCSLESIITAAFNRRWIWLSASIIILLCIGYTMLCNTAFEKILQPHQRTRIEVLFGMRDDPKGVGYNVTQAKIAIGSGSWLGKGFRQGTQTKLRFVPEQHTDFIFCTVGEEWGFLGSAAALMAYMIFILRLIFLAERQRDVFSQVYAYSVASIFLVHLTINIGMVLGMLPVIGIPLPFFSYGGSSLWAFTCMLFILLRLDAARVEKL